MTHINFKEINRTETIEIDGKKKIVMDIIAYVLVSGEELEFQFTAHFDEGFVFYDKDYIRMQLRDAKLIALFRPSLREWIILQI